MTLYLVLLLYIPLILMAICPEKDGRILKNVFLYIFLFFIMYHVDAGPDHYVYEWSYNEPLFSIPFEPLFSIILATSNLLGLDYIGFLIILRLICFILLAYISLKLDKTRFIFFMGLYIPISFITFELNLLRQSLSLHFGLVAACFYISNQNKKSYFFMVLAILSHLSAIVMVLIYLKRIRMKVLLFVGGVGIMILMLSLPAIMSKFNDYQELGALNIRVDVAVIQLIVIMALPFVFFKTQGGKVPVIFYILLCCLTLIPVLIRLYPIALLIILPSIIAARGNKKVITLLLFLCLSFFMAIGKTNLLLQADQNAIKEGTYLHGYTK